MKKRFLTTTGLFVLSAVLLIGCGNAASGGSTSSSDGGNASSETTDNAPANASETATTGLANPWQEVTEDEAKKCCVRLFKAPDGATDIVWRTLQGSETDSATQNPLVELDFKLNNLSFTARAQQGAGDDVDISGMNYNFPEPETGKLANWGEGNMECKTYRAKTDSETADLCTWYDVEIGIPYSLSVVDKDLDGFDIQAVAESMYCPENEPDNGGNANFVSEQAGREDFKDYNDVISCLKADQGYAYLTLSGYDGEILAVADLVFGADSSAPNASLFAMDGDKVVYLGEVSGNGSAYPLRYEDGVLYGGDNHNYTSYFMVSAYPAIMVKDSISDGIEGGGFSGFTRESNDFDHDKEFTGGQEEFDKLISERENKALLTFTTVK